MRPLLLLPLLLAGPLHAAPAALRFCHEDQDAYPWVLQDRPGLDVLLIQRVARRLNTPITLHPLPWKRCLAELQSGHMDGAFAASYKEERLGMGRYPSRQDGRLDITRRLHLSSYSLYRVRGNPLDWDGKTLHHLQGAIGTLSGFAIADFLRAHGASVDDSSSNPESTLRKLALGRLQGAALQTPRADRLLRRNPALARQLERLPLPLEERPYYLLLSFSLTSRQPALSRRIWDEIRRVRESAEYRQVEHQFYTTD